MSSDLEKWADKAMFKAEPPANYSPTHGVMPEVRLLWMTPDPLGALAACNAMYEGRVIRSLEDVTDEQRAQALDDMQHAHLNGPLESIKMHFLFDGVDRAFTHQDVRQRTAFFAQESLRFAVVEDLEHNVSLPPSLFGTMPLDTNLLVAGSEYEAQAQRWRYRYDKLMRHISEEYSFLVNDGMPQEDARAVLPHAVATRIEHVTDLRNLIGHAGNRLCTQAQFHWRLVFNGIVDAIRNYAWGPTSPGTVAYGREWQAKNRWQFIAMADSTMFRPACYQQGKCPFKASFDRGCKIRSRVDAFAAAGVPSSEWSVGTSKKFGQATTPGLAPIDDSEWLMDPSAARYKR
jgi:flavin-dependent thymidylate synthase